MAIWQALRPTVIDSRIRGKAFWNEEFKFLVLERVKDLMEDSDVVRSLTFTLLFAPPVSLQKFSCFCSRLPFRVFTLESFFLSIFIFLSFFDCPIMHLTIQNSSRISEGLIKIFFCWLRKRDNSLVDYEKFLKEENSLVQVSTFNQNGLSVM